MAARTTAARKAISRKQGCLSLGMPGNFGPTVKVYLAVVRNLSGTVRRRRAHARSRSPAEQARGGKSCQLAGMIGLARRTDEEQPQEVRTRRNPYSDAGRQADAKEPRGRAVASLTVAVGHKHVRRPHRQDQADCEPRHELFFHACAIQPNAVAKVGQQSPMGRRGDLRRNRRTIGLDDNPSACRAFGQPVWRQRILRQKPPPVGVHNLRIYMAFVGKEACHPRGGHQRRNGSYRATNCSGTLRGSAA